jgi:hypothetical protein
LLCSALANLFLPPTRRRGLSPTDLNARSEYDAPVHFDIRLARSTPALQTTECSKTELSDIAAGITCYLLNTESASANSRHSQTPRGCGSFPSAPTCQSSRVHFRQASSAVENK